MTTDEHLRNRLDALADRIDELSLQTKRIMNDDDRVTAADMVNIIDELVLALTEAVIIKHEAP